jgi:hypothetical protein
MLFSDPNSLSSNTPRHLHLRIQIKFDLLLEQVCVPILCYLNPFNLILTEINWAIHIALSDAFATVVPSDISADSWSALLMVEHIGHRNAPDARAISFTCRILDRSSCWRYETALIARAVVVELSLVDWQNTTHTKWWLITIDSQIPCVVTLYVFNVYSTWVIQWFFNVH